MCKQLNVEYVSADKGYDDRKNRELLGEKKIRCNIPIRKYKYNRISSLKQGFVNEKEYHQRSKVETVFSVIKRRFDSVIYSRLERLKMKEIKLKNIVYNIYRRIKLNNNCSR